MHLKLGCRHKRKSEDYLVVISCQVELELLTPELARYSICMLSSCAYLSNSVRIYFGVQYFPPKFLLVHDITSDMHDRGF